MRFNERILLDIMYIDEKPVLHVVDEGAHLSVAQFRPRILKENNMDDYTEVSRSDLHKTTKSYARRSRKRFCPLFINIGVIANVEVVRTGIEAHSSLGFSERYYQPHRQTYRNTMVENPAADPESSLASSVQVMNGTIGPEGLVNSALFFGEFTTVHTKSETLNERAVLASRAKVAPCYEGSRLSSILPQQRPILSTKLETKSPYVGRRTSITA